MNTDTRGVVENGSHPSSVMLPGDNALADPLLGVDERRLAAVDDAEIRRKLLEHQRCCCCRSRSCVIFSVAVLGVVVGMFLFIYFVLLRLFVQATLQSAGINVTLMRVGAPVSSNETPIQAALSADLDVPDLNYTVRFTDSSLAYYPPGTSITDPNSAVTIGTMSNMVNSQISVDSNTSRALMDVQVHTHARTHMCT